MLKSEIKLWLDRYKKEIEKSAIELWNIPMPDLTEELFSLYETCGNRLLYENVYFTRRKYLAVYGLNAIIHREENNIKKVEEILLEICKEECWALPAHVDRKTDKDWKHHVDLFASETAQTVTEIISVLKDRINEAVINCVKKEVYSRVLDPFYNSEVPYANWENSKFNWNPVCAGSIGSASIYLMDEQPDKLKKCLERVCHSICYYMDGFEADGTCMEGLSYFTYGMTYFTGFADQLYNYTNKNKNLLANNKCKNIAEFQQKAYFKNGRTICFSDGDSNDHYRMGLSLYLSMQYSSVHIPSLKNAANLHSDNCYRWMALYRDYIWTECYLNYAVDGIKNDEVVTRRHTILPDAQWSICESENNVGMGIKGGHNDEPHNHNDIGSFFYFVGSELLLSDLGAGEYTKQYFSSERYEIFCNSSFGHNVPTINKMAQKDGKKYCCDKFEADGKGKTIISFGSVYEKGTIQSIIRKAEFGLDSGELTIEDSFSPTTRTESVEERLITQWKPEIKDSEILINAPNASCKIIIEDGGNITCNVVEHKDHYGNPIPIYVLEWNVEIKDETKCCYKIIPLYK